MFLGGLGITNTDHVIIYDTVNTFSAARVYWTFKVLTPDLITTLWYMAIL